MVSIMFNMSPKIGNDWDTVLEASFKEPEILTLFYIIDSARRSGQSTIYPPAEGRQSPTGVTDYIVKPLRHLANRAKHSYSCAFCPHIEHEPSPLH